jgi:hypothetical protein
LKSNNLECHCDLFGRSVYELHLTTIHSVKAAKIGVGLSVTAAKPTKE